MGLDLLVLSNELLLDRARTLIDQSTSGLVGKGTDVLDVSRNLLLDSTSRLAHQRQWVTVLKQRVSA